MLDESGGTSGRRVVYLIIGFFIVIIIIGSIFALIRQADLANEEPATETPADEPLETEEVGQYTDVSEPFIIINPV